MHVPKLKLKTKLAILAGAILILVSSAKLASNFSQAKKPAPAKADSNRVLATATSKPSISPKPSASPSPSPNPTKAPRTAETQAPTITSANATQANMRAGIAAGSSLSALSNADLANRLDGIKALGVGWVRYDIEWNNIEQRGPGQFDWSAYDRVVAAVSSHGLQTIGIIDYTPPWARRGECASSSACAPSDPNAFGRFAANAASHYKDIHTWEIWNEPNKIQYFQPASDPSAYTSMLKSAYVSIKQVDPAAVIITGGLSPADTGSGDYSPPDFATGIYNAGAGGFFDGLGHHPYTFPVTAAYPNSSNAWGQLTTLHNIMSAHGDGSKKIWPTEYGAPTGGPGPMAHANNYSVPAFHVDEDLQAQAVLDVFRQHANYAWLGPLMWYSYQDAGVDTSTNENFFGLIRADGSHKPAYDAFVRAVASF